MVDPEHHPDSERDGSEVGTVLAGESAASLDNTQTEAEDSTVDVPNSSVPAEASQDEGQVGEVALGDPQVEKSPESKEGSSSSLQNPAEAETERESPLPLFGPSRRRKKEGDLQRVGQNELRESRTVFLAPEPLNEARSRLGAPNGEIFFVFGAPGSGRSTLARNLALCLRPEVLAPNADKDDGAQVEVYSCLPQETRRLRTVLEAADRNRVVIVEEGAETLIPELKELSRGFLAERGLDLVLVTDRLQEIAGFKALWIPSTLSEVQLRELLKRQLVDWMSDESELWNRVSSELMLHLTSPTLIERFGRKLLRERRQEVAVEPWVLATARETAREAQHWDHRFFQALKPSQRLAALILGLFEGLYHKAYFQLLELGIHRLRSQGHEEFSDLRGLTSEDLAEAIHAEEVGGSLRFVAEVYRGEVIRQLGRQGSWLWNLIEELFRVLLADEPDLPRCLLVGRALARFAEGESELFWTRMNQLALSEIEAERLVAAAAIEAIARQSLQGREQVLQVLNFWLGEVQPFRPHSIHRLSTIFLAAWRLFESSGEQRAQGAPRHLMRLAVQRRARMSPWPVDQAQRETLRVQMLAVLLRLMETRPVATAKLLEVWLTADVRDAVFELAWLALMNLTRSLMASLSPPDEVVVQAVLRLLPVLLALPSGVLDLRFVYLILHWRACGVPEETLLREIESALGSYNSRLRLLKNLLHWAFNRDDNEPKDTATLRFVQNLCAGLQALLGAPIPLGRQRALLYLDGSPAAQVHGLSSRLANLARLIFGGCFDLAERHLGTNAVVGDAALSRTSLLVPLLEEMAPDRPQAILVAAAAAPSDFEDTIVADVGLPIIVLTPNELPGIAGILNLSVPAEAIQSLANILCFETFVDSLLTTWSRFGSQEGGSSWHHPAPATALMWPEQALMSVGMASRFFVQPLDFQDWLDTLEERLADRTARKFAFAECCSHFSFLESLPAPPSSLSAEVFDRWVNILVRTDWQGTRRFLRSLDLFLDYPEWQEFLGLSSGKFQECPWLLQLPPEQLESLRAFTERCIEELPEKGSIAKTERLRGFYLRAQKQARQSVSIEKGAGLGKYSLLIYVPSPAMDVRTGLTLVLKLAKWLQTCVVHVAGRSEPLAKIVNGRDAILSPDRCAFKRAPGLAVPILEEHDSRLIEKIRVIGRSQDLEDLQAFPNLAVKCCPWDQILDRQQDPVSIEWLTPRNMYNRPHR